MLLVLLGAWCLTLWADPNRNRREPTVAARSPTALPWKLVFLVFLVFLATVAVLLSQREWVRFGRPCWDNYCVYSELISSCLRHPSSETWRPLHAFMLRDYHSNSPLVPLLVAGTNLVSGLEIIRSYRGLCAAATVLGLFVRFQFLRRRLAVSFGIAATVTILLLTNIAVIRCSCFPQTDAFVFLSISLCLTRSFVFMERPTTPNAVACFVLVTAGLFIKLSFLPVLAMIPCGRRSRRSSSERAFRERRSGRCFAGLRSSWSARWWSISRTRRRLVCFECTAESSAGCRPMTPSRRFT